MQPTDYRRRLKRQAKALARAEGIAHSAALDRIARTHGFRSWSHLAAHHRPISGQALWDRMAPGDLALIGARPGQGKTLLAFDILIRAVATGRRALLFTMEETGATVLDRFARLGLAPDKAKRSVAIDASDRLHAGPIAARIAAAPTGAVAAIDYLQLLDRDRSTPPLSAQLRTLAAAAVEARVALLLLTQISPAFDGSGRALPGLGDLRLHGPTDLSPVTRACFLHRGRVAVVDTSAP